MNLTKDNEKILKEKFQYVFENHFDEIPYFKDMKYEMNIDIEDIARKLPEKPKRSYRGLKIASILFVIILCSSALTIVISNGSVEAGKDKIWDIVNSLKGDDHKITDKAYSLEINDINDQTSINKAKDILPNLILMEEVLGGYIFDYMTVDKVDKNNIFTYSVYYKDNTMLSINQSSSYGQVGVNEPYKQFKVNNGTLLLNKDIDEEEGINSAVYIKGYDSLEILGVVGLDELEEFMRNKIIPQI